MASNFQKRAAGRIKTFWIFSGLAVISLLGFAAWQMNLYIHASSQVADYQKQIASIAAQNDQLEVKLSQLNSLNRFGEYISSQKDNFEKVDVASVRYVALPGTQLAQK